ncbi:MAG: bifunctional glutamate N-acetyltransferase/amino-acid acetyltransferase ArgJ [Deltaproteobacteria bacterium]|nr:bifunctional glutamate N-acetyltransferase/amino-acid acetyltransferase ArgJ [Deltaproteobacteria bacterium]
MTIPPEKDLAIPLVPGFRFSGLASGIKSDGAPDLALVAANRALPSAAVFTQNLLCAAPVALSRQRVASGRARAVLVNSGNANAATGALGLEAAERTTDRVAQALGCPASEVLVASTGVIGVPLPDAPFEAHTGRLVEALDEAGAADFARAILTTDRWPKLASREIELRGQRAPVVGIAKGAGMIHPDMATTLAFVLTSVAASAEQLRRALLRATELTFNRITVDGDTSTNDTIVCMASGADGAPTIQGEADEDALEEALRGVLEELASSIVADGEGAEHRVRIQISGAPSERAALQVARTIATSTLVKTALHGCDPNWGRILAAAGRAGVAFDPGEACVRIGDLLVYDRGRVLDPGDEPKVVAVMRGASYGIQLELAAGDAVAHYDTCDLGHAYVTVNADYRS